jgi:2-amino-4-hydroxy-6-hydroxymethyldihydropteridine diphosphokinase
VALGLGANQGDARRTLRAAVAALTQLLDAPRVAPLYRSRPRSPIAQPDYLNTVVVGRCRLLPEALLASLKGLELAAGRRPGPRGGPRPLDLDLLLYGERVERRAELVLPHPRLRARRFALAPLADLVPDLAVPPDGATVRSLLRAVGQSEEVTAVGWSG